MEPGQGLFAEESPVISLSKLKPELAAKVSGEGVGGTEACAKATFKKRYNAAIIIPSKVLLMPDLRHVATCGNLSGSVRERVSMVTCCY